jgi:hypothetical protein
MIARRSGALVCNPTISVVQPDDLGEVGAGAADGAGPGCLARDER